MVSNDIYATWMLVWIMADEAELREQMETAFQDADYPISSPMELIPALPNGPSTKFESEGFSMTAMELNAKLDGDFPYESPENFVDDIIAQLKDQNEI